MFIYKKLMGDKSQQGVKTRLAALLLVTALVLSQQLLKPAHASLGGFGEAAFGIDLSRVTLDSDTDPELNPGGIRFRLGYQVSTYVDVVGHLGFSFTESTESFDDIGLGYFSGFLKGYLPIGGNHAFYGLLGWTAASLSQDVRRGSFREDRAGFSWGAGAEVQVADRIFLNADFVSYIQSDGLFEDISAISIGLTFVY